MSIKLHFIDEGQHESSDLYSIIECFSEAVPRVGEKVRITTSFAIFNGIVRDVVWIIGEGTELIDQNVNIICHGEPGFI